MRHGQTVKGICRIGVLGLVGMNEERFLAVGLLDILFGDTWLEVEDIVGVCAEG